MHGLRLIRFLIILTLIKVSFAESYTFLKGRVFNKENGRTISNAEISIENTRFGTYSNENGKYSLKIPYTGKFVIIVSCLNYDSVKREVYTSSDTTVSMDFYLSPHIYSSQEITVSAISSRNSTMDVIIPSKIFQTIPPLAEADIFRSIQILPGISSTSDYSSRLFVRGSPSYQTLITFDGIAVHNPYHLGGIFGMFNADAIEKAEFYPGVYPVDYGGMLAGQLNVIPKLEDNERYNKDVSLGLLSSRFLVSGLIKKDINYSIAGRRFYLDLIEKLFTDDISGYYFYDFQCGLKYRLNNKNIFTFVTFFSRDILENILEDDELDHKIKLQQPVWGNNILSLKWFYYHNKHNYFITHLGYSSSELQSETFHVDINNTIRELSFKSSYFSNQSKNHSIQAGIEYKWLLNRYDWNIYHAGNLNDIVNPPQEVFFDDAPSKYKFNSKNSLFSIYLQDDIDILNNLQFKAGMRFNRTIHKNFNFEPRLQLVYFNKALRLSMSFARYHQYFYTLKENYNESFFAPFSVYFPVAKNRNPLQSDYYACGLELQDFLSGNLRMEAYYKNTGHIPVLNNYTKERQGLKGYSFGFDIFYQLKLNSLNMLASYTFGYSKLSYPSGKYFTSYDRRHSVKLFANYDLGRGWRLNAYWTYLSGLPYTPLTGIFFGAAKNDDEYEGFYIDNPISVYGGSGHVRGNINISRYPDYHRLDIGISKDWEFKESIFSFKFQTINVYNKTNPAFYYWDLNYQNVKRESFINLPIIPTFEFNYKW